MSEGLPLACLFPMHAVFVLAVAFVSGIPIGAAVPLYG